MDWGPSASNTCSVYHYDILPFKTKKGLFIYFRERARDRVSVHGWREEQG